MFGVRLRVHPGLGIMRAWQIRLKSARYERIQPAFPTDTDYLVLCIHRCAVVRDKYADENADFSLES